MGYVGFLSYQRKGRVLSNIIAVDFLSPLDNPPLYIVPKPTPPLRWWWSVLRFVDVDDLATEGRGAAIFFLDLLVNRPTEFTAFLSLFLPAYAAWTATGGLTARQEQAAAHATTARARGLNEARFASEQMGIHISAAYKLLARGRAKQEMATILSFAHVIYRRDAQPPTEAQIKRKMAAHRVVCPGKGWSDNCSGHATGRFGLCWSCNSFYGIDGERPAWLAYLVEQNRLEARQSAIDALTTVAVGDSDDFDTLLAA